MGAPLHMPFDARKPLPGVKIVPWLGPPQEGCLMERISWVLLELGARGAGIIYIVKLDFVMVNFVKLLFAKLDCIKLWTLVNWICLNCTSLNWPLIIWILLKCTLSNWTLISWMLLNIVFV